MIPRKLIELKIREKPDRPLVQEYQKRIENLISHIFHYVDRVYNPLISKHKALRNRLNVKLERFPYDIIDKINDFC